MQRSPIAEASTIQLSPDAQGRENKPSAAPSAENPPVDGALEAATTPPAAAPVFNINPELTPEQIKIVQAQLDQLKHTFATPKATPVESPQVSHEIHLLDPQPVKQAPYRQSPLKQEAIRKEIQKLLQSGIIVPSNSPWSSPVSLVPKPDGSWRMVIDYRRVNAKTRKDAYPVPLIDECLNACKDAD